MREKGQTEVAKTLETPVFSRGIEILTEKPEFVEGGLREIVEEYAGRVLLLWQENNDDA